jgi:hypothetical protein
LIIALAALAACGRTGLDAPVTFNGSAGGAAGQAGSAGGSHGGSSGGGTGGSFGGGAGGSFGGFGGGGFGGSSFGGFGGFGGGSVGGTGGFPTVCVEGTTICAGPNAARLCSGGSFGAGFPCMFGCFNGVCAECQPNTANCISDKELQVCDDQGLQRDPTPCEGACLGGACVGCAEGDTRCASHEGVQTCKGGQWTPAVDCQFVCEGKACTKKPRTVFVTSLIFPGGGLGGIVGADAQCARLANNANLPQTFLAWISDATTSPVNRFPEDVGPYVLVDGTIVANNWSELTLGVLRHKINLTELGGPPPLATGACPGPSVWTDTAPSGVLVNPDLSCNNWTDEMGFAALWGSADSLENWSDSCSTNGFDPTSACLSAAALFCFEQ